MNIVLIGMRGSGKTTVAKLLGRKLQKNVIDLDEELIRQMGMPIDQIVKKHGWDGFRKKECAIAKEVSLKNNMIISAGGGIILHQQNITNLKKHGTVVYLETSIEKIVQRIQIDSERPSLTDKKNPVDEMNELFQQRKHLYERAADIIVNTNVLKPIAIADQIIEKMKL